MADYLNKLQLFKQRIVDLADRAAALDKLRSEAAPLAAENNDRRAVKEYEQLDEQAAALRRETDLVHQAIEQTSKLQAEAEVEAAQKDLETRRAQAATLESGIATHDHEIDQLMVQLTQAFQRRQSLIKELAATRTVSSGTLSRMQSTSLMAGAARAAGLHKFIEIEHVAPSFVKKMNHRNEVSK